LEDVKTTAAPKLAAIYTRISDDRDRSPDGLGQATGLGVKRQEEACRELAAERGWEVVAVYQDDDISAFTGKARPRFEAMKDDIKAGVVNAIVAWAPARLTRHPRELEDLIDLLDAHSIEVATHIAGDYDLSTPGGRLVARIVGAVARQESEEKSERVKLKMGEIATAGGFKGGRRPYGYEADGVTIVPQEAEAIRLMAELVTEGYGLRRVQQELEARGISTAAGGPWKFAVIGTILKSPRIAGLRLHRGEIVGQAAWPAIIDRATWDKVQTVLRDPARKHSRPARYLLTGLVVNVDGVPLSGANGFFGHSTKRRIYLGPKAHIDADELDEFVTDVVLRYTDAHALTTPDEDPELAAALAALEQEEVEWAELRGQGEISLAEFMAGKKHMARRIAEARARLLAASPRVPAGVSGALGRPGGLRQAWPAMSVPQRQRALAAVLERVDVLPVGSGFRVPVEKRAQPVFRTW
jgi:site-specific DNA recombinase